MADKAPWADDIRPNINNHEAILLADVLDLLRGFLDDLACSFVPFIGTPIPCVSKTLTLMFSSGKLNSLTPTRESAWNPLGYLSWLSSAELLTEKAGVT
jgi:hypothetical protein